MWTLTDIEQIVREAGALLREMHPSAIESKEGHGNFVTECDRQIQEFLYERLHELVPEAYFVGEEEGKQAFLPSYRDGLVFVVDPIDGTANFVFGYRLSTISVGMLKEGRPYIGVVYNPYSDELFSAEKGKGAYLNGEPIRSSEAPLEKSLVIMGTSPYHTELKERTFAFASYYYDHSMDLRRSGTAAWDLCCVACGRAGLFCELILSLWDYAAGACILQEAGGKITNDRGEDLDYTGSSAIVAVSRGVSGESYLPEGLPE